MSGPLRARVARNAERRRWLILVVLCISLLVIVLDHSILNVAIPTIQRELDASTSQLQWIVDAYTLVLAGLLLTAGSAGDRFGRRLALQIGFAIFGLGSLLAALAWNANQLIALRAFMGLGGALITPATLSIITNLFPVHERARAIGFWAATAGAAWALGPLAGGALLEHFYWGSVFLVNVPLVLIALLAGVFLIPDSKDPTGRPLDGGGAILSIAGVAALLYGVINVPEAGWAAMSTLVAFTAACVLLTAFFVWERRIAAPMLDLSFFENPRFSAACGALTLTFFAMVGSLFLLTQYLQIVIGYSPIETGARLLAYAVPIMVVTPLSARFAERFGSKATIAGGMALMTVGLLFSTGLDESSGYGAMAWRVVIIATGMAAIMAPATDAIMGALPLARTGVGSALNSATRQLGGAIGVAVIGSVFASVYRSRIGSAFSDAGVTTASDPGESVTVALGVAARAPAEVGDALADSARAAFIDGFHAGLYVSVGAMVVGIAAVLIWLPSRARSEDVERRTAEWEATRTCVPD